MSRSGTRSLSWTAWLLFGTVAVLLWLGWFAELSGRSAGLAALFNRWVPAASVDFQIWAVVVAAVYSAVWLYMGLRWHLSSERALAHWMLGAALVWCLAMSLWLSALNAAKTYEPIMTAMGKAIPPHHNCIVTDGMGDSERGMLAYYAGIDTTPSWIKGAMQDCNLMLMQSDNRNTAAPQGWRPLWSGARDDSRGERFQLLVREVRPPTLPLARLAGGPYVGKHHYRRRALHGWKIHAKRAKPGNSFQT